MTDLSHLSALIEPEAQALGFALVRVKMTGGKSDPTLQVMAERPDTRQLTINDCSELSRRISDLFDGLEAEGRDPIAGAYRLEVSSPGIDRPLTRLSDFSDWMGHEARITLTDKLDGRQQFKGDLGALEGDNVTIVDAAGDVFTIPFAAIASAKLTMTDKLIAATAPLSTEGADEVFYQDPDAPADGATTEGQH